MWIASNLIMWQNEKTWKMGKCLWNKLWNLVVSKPENHNLMRKTAIKTNFYFSKKEALLFADTKLD